MVKLTYLNVVYLLVSQSFKVGAVDIISQSDLKHSCPEDLKKLNIQIISNSVKKSQKNLLKGAF